MKKILLYLLSLGMALSCLCLSSCERQPKKYAAHTFDYFDTITSITGYGKNGAFFVKFSYLEKNEKFSNRRFRVQNTQKMEVVGKMRSSGEDGDAHATDKLTKSGRRSKFRSTSFGYRCNFPKRTALTEENDFPRDDWRSQRSSGTLVCFFFVLFRLFGVSLRVQTKEKVHSSPPWQRVLQSFCRKANPPPLAKGFRPAPQEKKEKKQLFPCFFSSIKEKVYCPALAFSRQVCYNTVGRTIHRMRLTASHPTQTPKKEVKGESYGTQKQTKGFDHNGNRACRRSRRHAHRHTDLSGSGAFGRDQK